MGLLQRRRLIRADKGEIRRFKMGWGELCEVDVAQTAGKTNRWEEVEEEEGGKTARRRKLKCKTSVRKNRLNAAC